MAELNFQSLMDVEALPAAIGEPMGDVLISEPMTGLCIAEPMVEVPLAARVEETLKLEDLIRRDEELMALFTTSAKSMIEPSIEFLPPSAEFQALVEEGGKNASKNQDQWCLNKLNKFCAHSNLDVTTVPFLHMPRKEQGVILRHFFEAIKKNNGQL
jgi:hypothetical protein